MESSRRIFAKSVTWQISGFLVMSLVGFLFTGSFGTGAGIAISGAAIGFVSYFLHESLWARVGWGRS